MAHIAFDRVPVETTESAPIAFLAPKTPVEQAWADLCDEIENARVETVIACLGGWERMIETPITFRGANPRPDRLAADAPERGGTRGAAQGGTDIPQDH
jgi:hypothetical protein